MKKKSIEKSFKNFICKRKNVGAKKFNYQGILKMGVG